MTTDQIRAQLRAELDHEYEVHRRDVAEAEARERREREEGLAPHWRVSELARRFPCLNDLTIAGLYPFKSQAFHKATRGMSHGQRAAADFVLSVFNPTEWEFDVHDAMGVWDRHNRAVFTEWAESPWWA